MIHVLTTIPDRIFGFSARGKAFTTFTAGLIGAFAMAPYHLWFLLIISLGLFYILLSTTKSMKGAVFLSWLYGFGYFTAGLWWIGNALLVEGNEYKWAWPLAVLGLPFMLAFFPAACLGLTRKYIDFRRFSGFCAFIALLSLCEWLRGNLFTGFPWNLYGYAWGGIPEMIQIVSFGGVYFLTILTIFWLSAPAFVLIWTASNRQKEALLFIVFILLCGTYGYGAARITSYQPETHKNLNLVLVQTNIPQHEKWDRELFYKNFEKNLALSSEKINKPGLNLIIWPETTLTYHHLEYQESRTALQHMLNLHNGASYLMAGMLRRDGTDYMNSLAFYNSDLELKSAYDKSHLVPFGEYIPFQKYIPLKTVTSFAGFRPGNGPETIKTGDIPPYSPLICYEIIFPGKVVSPKNRPAWIINVTNDGWYGNSPGPYQHLSMAVYRAVEEGIPVVRSAGTGISAIVNPVGHVIAEIPYAGKAQIQNQLPQPLQNDTIFAKCKNIPFFIVLLICFAIGSVKTKAGKFNRKLLLH